MSSESNQTFITQDGSSSLLSGKFGEAYHSRFGAIEESNHVFIDAGLKYILENSLNSMRILEVGFGTGLNAILTSIAAQNTGRSILYDAVEAYPISLAEAKDLNYPELLNIDQAEFLQLHDSEWNTELQLHDHFKLTKHLCKFEDLMTHHTYDLVYFDAFAPSIQAHLWEFTFLDKIYKLCNKNAALVTYCAKGSFKRALKQCGFKLESLSGPAKKREMTRAIKFLD